MKGEGGGSQEEVAALRFILGKTSEAVFFSPQTVRIFLMTDNRRKCYSNCVLLYIDF